jgi:hypothetical protein
MKCPKCYSDNPDTSRFCADCGTKLPLPKEIQVSQTETLQIPIKELTTGTTFEGIYYTKPYTDVDLDALRDYPPFQELIKPKG